MSQHKQPEGRTPDGRADLRRALGQKGEDEGAAWLASKGFRILERNFRCPLGEIDIIGQAGETLVFVEVRSRRSSAWGTPAESVGSRKQRKLRQLAAYYMVSRGQNHKPCRFDVLGLLYEGSGEAADRIEWIADAF